MEMLTEAYRRYQKAHAAEVAAWTAYDAAYGASRDAWTALEPMLLTASQEALKAARDAYAANVKDPPTIDEILAAIRAITVVPVHRTNPRIHEVVYALAEKTTEVASDAVCEEPDPEDATTCGVLRAFRDVLAKDFIEDKESDAAEAAESAVGALWVALAKISPDRDIFID